MIAAGPSARVRGAAFFVGSELTEPRQVPWARVHYREALHMIGWRVHRRACVRIRGPNVAEDPATNRLSHLRRIERVLIPAVREYPRECGLPYPPRNPAAPLRRPRRASPDSSTVPFVESSGPRSRSRMAAPSIPGRVGQGRVPRSLISKYS